MLGDADRWRYSAGRTRHSVRAVCHQRHAACRGLPALPASNAKQKMNKGRASGSDCRQNIATKRLWHDVCFDMAQNPPSPPPFPSPEELKSKITEFMKQNFGDRVSVATITEPEPATAEEDEKPEKIEHEEFEFNLLPRDIKAHLDRFVIKQRKQRRSSRLPFAIITTMPITCAAWKIGRASCR